MVKLTNRCQSDQLGKTLKTRVDSTIHQRFKKVVQIVKNVAAKSDKSVERIHRLRTETRRADAALRLLADWLPHRRAKQMRQKLGRLRERAGRVRDLDVLAPHLQSLGSPCSREAVNWLQDRALKQRKANWCKLKRYCKHLLDRGIESESRSLTRQVCSQPFMMPSNNRELFASSTHQLAARFEAAIELLRSDTQQFHQVRILGRRLRYSLELMKEVYPDLSIESTCQSLSELQKSLGDANDRQFLLRFLQRCASECDQLPIAASLTETVVCLEPSIAIQLNSVIRDALTKAKEIKQNLEHLRFVAIPEKNSVFGPDA